MAPNNFPATPWPLTTANKACIRYEECLHNFGTKNGCYVFDGCGEFMKKGDEDDAPKAFICDACGCHRNFHRRIEPKQPLVHRNSQSTSVPPLHLYRHHLIIRAASRQAQAQAQNETSSEGSGIRVSTKKYL